LRFLSIASDPYKRRVLLLGLDEIGGILADDTDDIAAFEARQRQQFPWLDLGDGRLDALFSPKDGTKS
jgi:3-isopropylmalate/(R)-2-methylmalate dehydratase small subunit